jgi:hypothetical protein
MEIAPDQKKSLFSTVLIEARREMELDRGRRK